MVKEKKYIIIVEQRRFNGITLVVSAYLIRHLYFVQMVHV